MKRLISILLTAACLLGTICIPSMAVDGDALWSGQYTWNGATNLKGVDNVEALYFEEAPTLDGYVSAEEWGVRTLELHSNTLKGLSGYPFNAQLYTYSKDDKIDALVWLRWDEDYFYVAALVDDHNGHSLKSNENKTYQGDSFIFRVDPDGSREYNYSTSGTWSDEENIPEFVVGYTGINGGYTEVYELTHNKGLLKDGSPVFGEALAVVAPSEEYDTDPINYSPNSMAGYTTYEIAMPWKYIFENDLVPIYNTLTDEQKKPYTLQYKKYSSLRAPYGGIGYELGMSLGIIDTAYGSAAARSFLAWGTGLNANYLGLFFQGAGSNKVVLSGNKVKTSPYKTYDPSILDVPSQKTEFDCILYDYGTGDTEHIDPLLNVESLTSLTYDKEYHMDLWGSPDLYQGTIINVGGEHGNVLNFDRVLKTYVDANGNKHVAGVDPIEQYYIDTAISSYEEFRVPLSYTFEFDVMYTSTDIAEPNRISELGNWFGGESTYEYYCGYNFEEQAFVIRNSSNYDLEPLFKAPYNLEKNTWYNWKFQYDNESCTVRLYINDEQIFNVQNKYFRYDGYWTLKDGCLLIWWFINTQIKMDNVKMYNFYDYELERYDVDGYVTSAMSDNGVRNPVTVNLYREGFKKAIDSSTLKKSGTYTFIELPKGNYTIEFIQKNCVTISYNFVIDGSEDITYIDALLTKMGDADCDGELTSTDALCLKKYFVNLFTVEDISVFHADMNSDKVINAKDLLKMKFELSK